MRGLKSQLTLLKRHYPLLKHIAKCTAQDCEHIVNGLSEEVIKLMAQICINVMHKNLMRSPKVAVKRLSPYKKQLIAVTRPRVSLTKKRSILSQKGGFLSTLLAVALPVISSIIGSLTSRK